jgi:hypothetical protein
VSEKGPPPAQHKTILTYIDRLIFAEKWLKIIALGPSGFFIALYPGPGQGYNYEENRTLVPRVARVGYYSIYIFPDWEYTVLV